MKILVVGGSLLLLFFLAVRIWRTDRSAIRSWFWPALFVKIIAGFLVGWLYTAYYETGDTFSFFHDGVTLAALARDDIFTYGQFLFSGDASFAVWQELIFKQPRALFMTKCISLVNLLTFDNYWITSVYFSFISFLGAWVLVKRLARMFPQALPAAVMAFLFFPSVVFWSAGVIKESLAIPCLFFLTALLLKVWQRKRLRIYQWIMLPVAVAMLWNLKYYYAGVFLPVACTTLLVRYATLYVIRTRHVAIELLLWCGLFLLLLFGVTFLHPNFETAYLLDVIVRNNEAYNELSRPGNLIHYHALEPTAGSLLRNAPFALFSGLFRPFVWEAGPLPKWLAALENLVLAAGFIMAFRHIGKTFNRRYSILVMALVVYTVLLCVFIALSTPNFGTLARYRIGFLPYVVFLVFSHNRFIRAFFRYTERLILRLVRKDL